METTFRRVAAKQLPPSSTSFTGLDLAPLTPLCTLQKTKSYCNFHSIEIGKGSLVRGNFHDQVNNEIEFTLCSGDALLTVSKESDFVEYCGGKNYVLKMYRLTEVSLMCGLYLTCVSVRKVFVLYSLLKSNSPVRVSVRWTHVSHISK